MKRLILPIMLLFMAVLFSYQPGISQNLLTNPGFEDWTLNGPGGPPDGWALSGSGMTASQEAATIHGGTYSVNVTWTTTSTRWIEQTGIPVTAGGNYQFTFWAFDNMPDGRARVAVRWFDSGGSFIEGFYGDYTVDDPAWQQMTSGSLQAPANAVTASAEVRIYDVSGWSGTATVYVDDAEFVNVSGQPPVIVNAFATGTNTMDVVYDKDITTVDPSDYTLSGTANISFSTATIDGTNPKIVHLSNSIPAMTGDITVDLISDDGIGTSFEFYAGIMPVEYAHATNPGGVMDEIHIATFRGIVSANDAYNNVWIADNSGQYHGMLIYGNGFPASVNVGDEILFSGFKSEYNNLNEIINPSLITVLSTGLTPYGPDMITGSDIDENIAANTTPAEPWEGQLVTIENFTVESYTAYDYKCSWTEGPTTYYFHIGDNVDFQFANISISVGASYQSITGVIDWYWTGPYYRINPRNQADLVQISNPPVQLAVTSVNGGMNPMVNFDFDVVVQAQDAGGVPAVVSGDVNFTFTTNGGVSGLVGFVGGTTFTGTIPSGFSEVTVTGVQMAPAGAGVTITANDDAMILTPGTSAAFDVVEPVIPDIIITEIMQNPSAVTDNAGEYFELFNTTSSPIDINGWIIKDDDTDVDTIEGSLIVPAMGFVVLGSNDTSAVNGGYTCNYMYENYFLGNSVDEVVLCMPDGSEVDRVVYDNGVTFPDPNGAAMVFTGTPADDNNNGANWVTATLRELTYTGASGDLGSPGTNGFDQNLVVVAGFNVDLKVFLSGPYIQGMGGMMNTDLLSNGVIPIAQPFNPALPYYSNNNPSWLYAGTESVTAIPTGVVDWVLVELRDAANVNSATGATMIAQKAAFLLADGSVVGLDGTSMLNFNVTIANNLFAVVYHRNHLAVISAGPLVNNAGVYSYDFSSGESQANGGSLGHIEVETGIWGMISADGNADGQTNNADKIDVWAIDAANSGYLGGDFTLDTQCNNQDKVDAWVPNSGASSQVPN
ncbi:MAG: lamin tail domain-containing protein [Bacteroidales bacterium]|nr:lamin tail domain-containing protein [Bacteroidales bacterium]